METTTKTYSIGSLNRLKKEFLELPNIQSEGIVCWFVDADVDLGHMQAMITGPKDTPYEDGTFLIDIHLPESASVDENSGYPFRPPRVQFITKVFHPNISSSGEICLDIFHRQWSPAFTLSKTLLSIQTMLSNPNFDDFIEPEPAFLHKENPEEFNRKAAEWTRKHAMFNKSTEDANKDAEVNAAEVTENIFSASSNPLAEPETVEIKSNTVYSLARFTDYELPREKTLDNAEFKGHPSIIVRCLRMTKNSSTLNRNEIMNSEDFVNCIDVNEEIQLLISSLQAEQSIRQSSSEVEDLIDAFYQLIDATPEQLCQASFLLYLMEPFLNSKLNQYLREADIRKMEAYGPFVRLFYFSFNHPSSIEVHSTTVYHGMDLSPIDINTYKEDAKNCTTFQWMGFISTTKSLELTENFKTNTIFIMQLRKVYANEKRAINISSFSDCPDEQEILLAAGIEFTVEKVEFDEKKQKHNIFLNVYV